MLCTCSGEQFKFDDAPQSPESLATRDFSASGLSSRTGDVVTKYGDVQVEEAESTLKEALSLNYEEARALLGRLEYQRGNADAALQVFQGIDIKSLTPSMIKAIVERTRPRKPRSKGVIVPPGLMSMHSVSLLLEAILLKAKSLAELGQYVDAAKECKIILDTIESALPDGMPEGIGEDSKLQDMFHEALELLPHLWSKAGFLDNAINAYRWALVKPWNLNKKRLVTMQKDLAIMLLYGGVEVSLPSHLSLGSPNVPTNNIEEAILLLLILMKKVASGEIKWEAEIINHLTYAVTITGQFKILANHVEQALPGIYNRAERWYLLALCYSAAGDNDTALNLLKKVSSCSEANRKPHMPSSLLAAKLCSQEMRHAHDGIKFAKQIIDMADHQYEHFIGDAHKLLGISYGTAARASVSDSERALLQCQSLKTLNYAANIMKNDPELRFSLGLQNAMLRHLNEAFEYALAYSDMTAGSSVQGWRLLALILSAQQNFKDAETIVDFALDESGRMEQMQLLKLKAGIQIAQEDPKQAIETYRILLSLIQAQKEIYAKNSDLQKLKGLEGFEEQQLEATVWQDLATLYTKICSWHDADICLRNSKSIELYSPGAWHKTGKLFEAQSMLNEALVSLSTSLSLQPDYVPSIISTAEVLMKFGSNSIPAAKSFLLTALKLEPTNHKAWLNLGLIAKYEGFLQQAAEYLQAAYELEQSAPLESFV